MPEAITYWIDDPHDSDWHQEEFNNALEDVGRTLQAAHQTTLSASTSQDQADVRFVVTDRVTATELPLTDLPAFIAMFEGNPVTPVADNVFDLIQFAVDGRETRQLQDVTRNRLRGALLRFFEDVLATRDKHQVPAFHAWLASSEALLTHLQRLLERERELESALTDAYGDLDLAKARIRYLEGVVVALEAERSGTGKPDKTLLVLLATAVFTLLGPLASVFLDHALDEDEQSIAQAVEQTVNAAQQVQVDCGNTVVINATASPDTIKTAVEFPPVTPITNRGTP